MNSNDAGARAVAEAGAASARDAAMIPSQWEGVSLGPSVTTAPDGAVISRDGGISHYDPDAAGPVLNAEARAACVTLASNICARTADCESSLLQLSSAQRDQRFQSCQDAFFRSHDCNRASRVGSGFNDCAAAVKTRDCLTVFTDDFASACSDQLTFQP